MQLHSKQITILGVFTAVGLLLGFIESMLVIPISVPGVKIGLSNIIILIVMYIFGSGAALMVLLAKVLLSGLLFGSGVSILYSLGGALLSFLFMFITSRFKNISPVGVSTVGGVMHNIGQIIVAAILAMNINLLYYIPVLVMFGAIAGFITGILALILIKRLGNIFIELSI